MYNLITCTNVLSAIPCKETLNSVILSIKKLLSSDGIAVFINQHRSSYFKKFESGKRHLNGYLYSNQKSTSYYGIFNRAVTQDLLLEHGFEIIKSWCVGRALLWRLDHRWLLARLTVGWPLQRTVDTSIHGKETEYWIYNRLGLSSVASKSVYPRLYP